VNTPDTAATTALPRRATPVVLPATLQRWPRKRWAGRALPSPTQAACPAPHAARLRAACAEHDCGPLRMTGIGERSVPSAGGPYHSRPRSLPDAPSGDVAPRSNTGGYQSSARAVQPAPDALSPSGASVLGWKRHCQPFPTLFPPPGQNFATPTGRHPRPETMLVDSPAIARPV